MVSLKLLEETAQIVKVVGEEFAPQATIAAEKMLADAAAYARPRISKVADNLFSHDIGHGIYGHEASHLGTFEPGTGMFEGDKPLKIIPREAVEEPPQSMSPKAYKVVRVDGSANWDPGTQYPLPNRLPDGQWQPGNWVEPGKSELLRMLQGSLVGDRQPGLYISNNPHLWKASEPGMVTYEVEVGDAHSRALWENAASPLRVDFTAQRLRLLRPISGRELNAIKTTPYDHLGFGVHTS